jgi:hypothetical protein
MFHSAQIQQIFGDITSSDRRGLILEDRLNVSRDGCPRARSRVDGNDASCHCVARQVPPNHPQAWRRALPALWRRSVQASRPRPLSPKRVRTPIPPGPFFAQTVFLSGHEVGGLAHLIRRDPVPGRACTARGRRHSWRSRATNGSTRTGQSLPRSTKSRPSDRSEGRKPEKAVLCNLSAREGPRSLANSAETSDCL